MPGYDGTGPAGTGQRTGGGFGYCPPVGGAVAGAGPVRGLGRGGLPWGCGRGFGGGRGRGMGGRGRGLGFGYGYAGGPYAAGGIAGEVTAEAELQLLRAQAESMRRGLDEVERRIADMQRESSDQ